MVRQRAYRTALFPTVEQRQRLLLYTNATRRVYNWGLARRIEHYRPVAEARGRLMAYGLAAEYREIMQDASQSAAQQKRLLSIERTLHTFMHQDDTVGVQSLIEEVLSLDREELEAEFAERKKAHKPIGHFDQCKQLTQYKQTPEGEWLTAAPSSALQAALQNLDRGFKAFFRRVKSGEEAGFPKFKSFRSGRGGFKFFAPITVTEKGISLPKINGPIMIATGDKEYVPRGRFQGKPSKAEMDSLPQGERWLLSGAVTTERGRWFLSLTMAEHVPDPTPGGVEILAVHFGLSRFATLSNGVVIPNPRYLQSSERKLRKTSKSFSRKVRDPSYKRGSGNRFRMGRERLQDLHAHVADQRKEMIHEFTTALVTGRVFHGRQVGDPPTNGKPRILVLEDWSITSMLRESPYREIIRKDGREIKVPNRRYQKGILDAAWGMASQQATYKSAWNGVRLIFTPKGWESSQRCSQCGEKNPLMVDGRTMFHCPSCGHRAHRDDNAVRNLYNYAVRVLHGETQEIPSVSACE